MRLFNNLPFRTEYLSKTGPVDGKQGLGDGLWMVQSMSVFKNLAPGVHFKLAFFPFAKDIA